MPIMAIHKPTDDLAGVAVAVVCGTVCWIVGQARHDSDTESSAASRMDEGDIREMRGGDA